MTHNVVCPREAFLRDTFIAINEKLHRVKDDFLVASPQLRRDLAEHEMVEAASLKPQFSL